MQTNHDVKYSKTEHQSIRHCVENVEDEQRIEQPAEQRYGPVVVCFKHPDWNILKFRRFISGLVQAQKVLKQQDY